MESIEIKLKLPKYILSIMRTTEKNVERSIKEAIAVDLYRRQQISLEKAAEIMDFKSRWDMIPILAKHDVWFGYTAEDAKQDWETLQKVLDK